MTITLIGAGNVGTHLGKRLYQRGFNIHQVFSRKYKHAQELAQNIEGAAVNDLSAIDAEADLYILLVHDDAIISVAEQLSKNKELTNKLVVHTSGAASSQLIAKYFQRFGVFYPLQSFSKTRKLSFANIPICVEAGSQKDLILLKKIGKKISQKVVTLTNKERSILHVTAVIVNNFTNHLFHLSEQILSEEQIAFDLLKPLIQETISKIKDQPPYEMQTGPARRKDQKTIQKHLIYLEKHPGIAKIYQLLSKSISNAYRR